MVLLLLAKPLLKPSEQVIVMLLKVQFLLAEGFLVERLLSCKLPLKLRLLPLFSELPLVPLVD